MTASCVGLSDEEGYDPKIPEPAANNSLGSGNPSNQSQDSKSDNPAESRQPGNTAVDPDSGRSLESGFSFVHLLFMILFVAIVCCVVIWLRWVVMRFRETRRMAAQVRIEAQNIEQSAVSQESGQAQP